MMLLTISSSSASEADFVESRTKLSLDAYHIELCAQKNNTQSVTVVEFMFRLEKRD